MAATIDVRAVTDAVEFAGRQFCASLGVPQLPDKFWDDLTAELTPVVADVAVICLNACAVMADCSPMTLEES